MENIINKKITLVISTIIAILLLTIGVTFAYFAAQSSTVAQTITTGTLRIGFTTGNVLRTQDIIPITEDLVDTKATELNFSVKNTGDITGYFDINLTDIVIDEELKSPDFKWKLLEGDTVVSNGHFLATGTTKSLIHNISIEPNITKTYKLLVWLNETNTPQNEMQGKSLTAKITVKTNDRQKSFALSENPVLENTVENGVISNLRMYGNSVQNGIPTPDNPVEIQSVGERTKNLFDKKNTSVIIQNLYPNSNVYSTGSVWRGVVLQVKPNTTYTLSKLAGQTCYLGLSEEYPANGVAISGRSNTPTSTSISVTTGENDKYLTAFFYRTNADTIDYQTILDSIFITEGTSTEYEPYGYKIPIKVRGENLFDKDNSKYTRGYISTENGGSIVNSDITDTFYIECKPNTTYIITRTNINVSNQVWRASSTSNIPINGMILDNMVGGLNNDLTLVITTSNDAKYLLFTEGRTLHTDDLSKFEIRELTTTNIYLDEPLRAIGNYKDYIDFESGKIVRYIKKKQLTTVSSLYTYLGKVGFYTYDFLDFAYNRTPGLSNREDNFEQNTENTAIWLGVNTNVLYWVGILDELGFTTKEEMTNWLSENETWIYWVSKNKIEKSIELPSIKTLGGTTYLSTNTTVKPSFEGSY